MDDSQGIQHFTRYTYPDNLHINIGGVLLPQWPGLYLLQQRHQISKPIEIISGYMDGDNEYVTGGMIHLYKTGCEWLPSSGPKTGIIPHYYPYLYQTLSLSLLAPISDYRPIRLCRYKFSIRFLL